MSGGVTVLSIIVSAGVNVVSGFKKIVDVSVRQLLTSKAPVVELPQYPSSPFSHIVKEESKYSQEPSSIPAAGSKLHAASSVQPPQSPPSPPHSEQEKEEKEEETKGGGTERERERGGRGPSAEQEEAQKWMSFESKYAESVELET